MVGMQEVMTERSQRAVAFKLGTSCFERRFGGEHCCREGAACLSVRSTAGANGS